MGKQGWMGAAPTGDCGPYDWEDDEPNGLWEDCETCGGEGVFGHDCGEDTCCCLDPEENLNCHICEGTGGWYIGADGKPVSKTRREDAKE